MAGEPFFVGTIMMEVAFVQYEPGRTEVAQQLPVLLVECGRGPQAHDEVLTYVREFSVGHGSPPLVLAARY
jgi:hypothetical protein